MRTLAKAILPAPWRRYLRRKAREAPQRLRDLPEDIVCLFHPRAFGGPLPPPGLRSRVGGVSRREFELVGREGSQAILQAFERTRDPNREYPDWLDFGCGCGRIARIVASAPAVARIHGVDVDPDQIRWARRRLSGNFTSMSVAPPLDFASSAFDVIYAVSIFTHLTEVAQFGWLAEIRRLLKPHGLFIATTHHPELARSCPGLTEADLARLCQYGFLAADGGGNFNERSTFHSARYLEQEWGKRMTRLLYEPYGFVKYQDLSVWDRTSSP